GAPLLTPCDDASVMRWFAAVAALIAAVVDVLYYGVVSHQGPLAFRVAFVATFIALLAITAALSTRASATTWRPALLALSAIGLLSMGFIGIFSLGLPLLIAGALAFVALIFRWPHPGSRQASSKRALVGCWPWPSSWEDLRQPSTRLDVRPMASRRVADRAS